MNLYRVYEIVKTRADIVANGWASENDLSRFTHTANHPALGGPDARHARLPSSTQPRSVSLGEAIALIECVLTAWLDSLSPS